MKWRDGIDRLIRRSRTTDIQKSRSPSTPAPLSRKHIAELDGLRGFAILLVLITHFWTYPGDTQRLNHIAGAGWMGVDLFFVLSGFLITGILWDARGKKRYFTNFIARRTLRIFPLYYLLLLVVFILLPTIGLAGDSRPWQEDGWLYFFHLSNFALASGGWQTFALDITWSLSIEEQFYLVWPLVVRFLNLRRILAFCLSIVILVPIARWAGFQWLGLDWMWMHMMMPLRTDGFALGALVALAWKEDLVSPALMKALAVGTAAVTGPLLLFLIVLGAFGRETILVGTIGYSLVALLSAALIVIAIYPGTLTHRVLTRPSLRHLGTVSYGVYVFHPLCFLAVVTIGDRVGLGAFSATSHPVFDGVLFMLFVSLVSVAFASLLFEWFEKPILRLKQHFPTDDPTRPREGPEGTKKRPTEKRFAPGRKPTSARVSDGPVL